MAYDRMFRVIVLGGVALVGGPACSSSVVGTGDAAGDTGGAVDTGTDTFPHEGPVLVDVQSSDATDAFSDAGATDVIDTFPREGPVQFDAHPPPADTGADVGSDTATPGDAGGCFPRETAIAQDC